MNASSCAERRVPTTSATSAGRSRGRDDAGAHRVLEVVAHVGDAVGPRHDLALGGHGRRPVPAVVAHRVECLGAQVERRQHDVGAVDRVVIPARHVTATAPPPTRDRPDRGRSRGQRGRFGERHVQARGAGDADRDLRDLDGVREAVAEMVVVGRDEHLALAGQATERRGCA